MVSPRAELFAYLVLLALFSFVGCSNLGAQPKLSSQEDCPTTKAGDPETRLFGPEDSLQVFITNGGIWNGLPPGKDGGFGQKIFWKYPGYSQTEDPTPAFTLTSEQLDGDGTFEFLGPATNAGAVDLLGSAILTGVEFPEAGCWQLTGQYRDSQLSFVVWVGD
ncbi:MAG TPA: hypothetical protein VI688_00875 [Anaerolineales bacterium]|nr:hypothetical protein [Anaerolineales bacterium]